MSSLRPFGESQRQVSTDDSEYSRVEARLLTLGDLVLEFDLGLENVRGGPGLGEGYTVLGIDVLGLEVTSDGVRLGIAGTGDTESDVVGGAGLRESRNKRDREILNFSSRLLLMVRSSR